MEGLALAKSKVGFSRLSGGKEEQMYTEEAGWSVWWQKYVEVVFWLFFFLREIEVILTAGMKTGQAHVKDLKREGMKQLEQWERE